MTSIHNRFDSMNKSYPYMAGTSTKLQNGFVWRKKKDRNHEIKNTIQDLKKNLIQVLDSPSKSKRSSKIHKWVWRRKEDPKQQESKKTAIHVSKVAKIENDFLEKKPMPIPGLILIKNFISKDLHDEFVQQMKKASGINRGGYTDSYKKSHGLIQIVNKLSIEIYSKLKKLKFSFSNKPNADITYTLLGYEKNGFMSRHIDSNEQSGGPVVIITFNSSALVNFYSEKKRSRITHSIIVPPMSMYAMSNEARYDWSHDVSNKELRFVFALTPRGTKSVNNTIFKY